MIADMTMQLTVDNALKSPAGTEQATWMRAAPYCRLYSGKK